MIARWGLPTVGQDENDGLSAKALETNQFFFYPFIYQMLFIQQNLKAGRGLGIRNEEVNKIDIAMSSWSL